MSTKTLSPQDLDIRIRERQLKSGNLSEKDVEKFISSLPDLADACEPVSLAQPALEAPEEVEEADDLDDEPEAPSAEEPS